MILNAHQRISSSYSVPKCTFKWIHKVHLIMFIAQWFSWLCFCPIYFAKHVYSCCTSNSLFVILVLFLYNIGQCTVHVLVLYNLCKCSQLSSNISPGHKWANLLHWFDKYVEVYLKNHFVVIFLKLFLKRKFQYKRTSPSHIRHHLISTLIKSCSTQGRSNLLPKELKNETIKTNCLVSCAVDWQMNDIDLGLASSLLYWPGLPV